MDEKQPPMREVYLCPGRQYEKRSPVHVIWIDETRDRTIRVPDPRAIDNSISGKGNMETVGLSKDNSREVLNGERCSFSNAYSCQECMARRAYLFPKEREEKIAKRQKAKSSPKTKTA